ncbi:sensor domain-containing diguanylate cyclase [Chimaeribacter arupi]|nr:GGDEF domain-containing protein [Chimaeribacter arupi]
MALSRFKSPDRVMAVFLLIIAVAVVFVVGWSMWQSWQHTLQDTEKQARNQSISLSRQAEDTFLQVQITLEDIVRHGDDIFANPASYLGPQGLLGVQKSRLPQLHGLFVYDAQGNWLATSGRRMYPQANNADREYFIWHRTHNDARVHVGHVIHSRSTGDLIIPVSLRLNDDQGRFRGVVLGTVRVDFFRQFYGYYEMSPKDILGLTHLDATVMYVRPFSDRIINKSMADTPLYRSLLKASPQGAGTWHSPIDGVTRIFGYAQLQSYPLVVAVGIDRDLLKTQWIKNNLAIICLNVLLLMTISLFGMLVLKQFRKTVRHRRELMQTQDELTRVNLTLQDLALIDSLTGLGNRRQFDIYLEQCLARASLTGAPVSLIMCDIDFFKSYNDTFGHVAGDECLRRVADVLKYLPRRSTDVVARYGGEEFAVILPGTPANEAEKVAKRIRYAIHNAALPHHTSLLPDKIITLSAGISTSTAGDDATTLKQAADAALYAAKRAGRDCIINAACLTDNG